ncbi:hypothetical protein GCM10007390_10370 [Persicitalea jodogahamensis]|uniref:BioF2-like acetyltransferase domain-containing protein n=1 Tax=Persicitalea jodogahamensis TaxID=402147 RepID=A0A8J3G8G5_9BACT|nr:hypothetical protein GCM10007390_10370 [Persicitalea jodogahamensis]
MQPPALLKRHQIDDQAWNALIERSEYPVIYPYTWYLDCVSPGWQCLVWPSAQNYEIVMPLPVKKRWGLAVVQQPLFCQYLGLFSESELSEEAMAVFLESLSRHFIYISSYDFHPRHTPLLRKLTTFHPEFETTNKSTHWLNLKKPYTQLAYGYKKDRKNNLKKSKKYRWDWIESQDAGPLITLFRKNHAPKIKNVKESAYQLLSDLASLVLEKNSGIIRYARIGPEIHAGVMVLEENGMGIYIFNAADAVGRKGNARTFLLDQYFREAAGQLRTFDFESPEVDSISAFYESFGAEKRAFFSIKKNELPFPLRQLQNFRRGLMIWRETSLYARSAKP